MVTGIVQSVLPYGAFVDLGGVTGLLHVSQISHGRVDNLTKILSEGDKLKVGGWNRLSYGRGRKGAFLPLVDQGQGVHDRQTSVCVSLSMPGCKRWSVQGLLLQASKHSLVLAHCFSASSRPSQVCVCVCWAAWAGQSVLYSVACSALSLTSLVAQGAASC